MPNQPDAKPAKEPLLQTVVKSLDVSLEVLGGISSTKTDPRLVSVKQDLQKEKKLLINI